MNQPLPASAPPYAGAPDSPRRAFRALDDSLVGGVASGLARHLGVPVLWMRAAFLIATAIGGFGIVTYAALWLLLPAERHFDDAAPGLSAATRQGMRQGRRAMALADAGPLVALAAIAIGVIALVAGLTGGAVFLWEVSSGDALAAPIHGATHEAAGLSRVLSSWLGLRTTVICVYAPWHRDRPGARLFAPRIRSLRCADGWPGMANPC